MSLAKVIISGTLTSDPEKRFTSNDHAVTNFTLSAANVTGAQNRQTGGEAFDVKVTCWRNLAEAVQSQLKKGDEVVVEGKLMMESFQTQEGVQKKGFEIEASSISKLSGKPEPVLAASMAGNEGSQGYTPRNTGMGAPASSRGTEAPSSGHFSSEELLTEDDIPF